MQFTSAFWLCSCAVPDVLLLSYHWFLLGIPPLITWWLQFMRELTTQSLDALGSDALSYWACKIHTVFILTTDNARARVFQVGDPSDRAACTIPWPCSFLQSSFLFVSPLKDGNFPCHPVNGCKQYLQVQSSEISTKCCDCLYVVGDARCSKFILEKILFWRIILFWRTLIVDLRYPSSLSFLMRKLPKIKLTFFFINITIFGLLLYTRTNFVPRYFQLQIHILIPGFMI